MADTIKKLARKSQNERRALLASDALTHFTTVGKGDPYDRESECVDLMANLMHYAKSQGWDVLRLNGRAYAHFRHEDDGRPE